MTTPAPGAARAERPGDHAAPGNPALIVVSGEPASGKTTLAHTLAARLGCPVICRDEIRTGIARAGTPDDRYLHTLDTFFAVLRTLTAAGVSTVAEAAFQGHVWRPRLNTLDADVRVIHCTVPSGVIRERLATRALRDAAHDDLARLAVPPAGPWEPLGLAVPTLEVSTDGDYSPTLPDIERFCA
ncbi:AAA family ATPase [Winogradskya humida]|uniref:Kinase n=1 Tax=Winogradskya humida TaxID=113566 RepID=A0ABQ3ZI42_9ACTN|nr:AAA family ATPase [Actinoplanes humidus]GIE18260.1 hypothetical protein Ahu01nite_013620 [Actinoplanes humidus]